MAHNLATIQNKVAMMYVGSAPWHKLGQRLTACTNVQEALAAASLDWAVATVPLYLADGTEVPIRRAVLRDTDKAVLGTVGPDYTPVQNADGFAPLQDACDRHGVSIETAGALGDGHVVWMLAKLPGEDEVRPGDAIKPYFLISTSHDGSKALSAVNTPIRVVCQNTLNAVASRRDISIRHTASATSRLREVKALVEELATRHEITMRAYRALAGTPVDGAEVAEYVGRVFPAKKPEATAETLQDLLGAPFVPKPGRMEFAKDAVLHLFGHGKGNTGQDAWSAYNAVTEYVDHVGVSTQAGAFRQNGARGALFGAGAQVKQSALAEALDMWAPAFSRN